MIRLTMCLALTALTLGVLEAPARAHGPRGAAESASVDFGIPRFDYQPPPAGSYELPTIKTAADSRVVDAAGARRRLHELLGKRIVVLSFISTRCADAHGCPLATAVLQQIGSAAGGDAALAGQLGLVTVSFDLPNDTPAVLARYAQAVRNGQSATAWDFVVPPTRAELSALLEAYGQPVGLRGRTAPPSHLLRVYLIDRERRIRNVYGLDFLDSRLLLTDVRTLLFEEQAGQPRPAAADDERFAAALARVAEPPLGLPAVPVPADNPPTAAKVALGRKLFFDRRLSHNGTMSCAMCHVPEQGFTNNELARAVGVEGRSLRRNAPTLLNVAYVERLFHDGREIALETQALGPLVERSEMGNPSVGHVVALIRGLHDYAGLFERAFGAGPSPDRIGQAIASYERTLLLARSPFDRWYFGGESSVLGTRAVQGFRLFTGKAGCVGCHTIGGRDAVFSDGAFHDTGIGYHGAVVRPRERMPVSVELEPGVTVQMPLEAVESVGDPEVADLGRHEVTLAPPDIWKFRTPTLRNVALTAPYMHDGSLRTLEDVVRYYDRGAYRHPGLDPQLRPLGLDESEVTALVEFLQALTGADVTALIDEAREPGPPD
jgi:cytochrome c peroxidase